MAIKKSKKRKMKKVARKQVKKAVKKAAPVKKTTPIGSSAVAKSYTKSELQRALANHAGVTKQEVGSILDGLTQVIHNHMKDGACGLLKLEGLMKIQKIHKPAKKAREGVNPFTGEKMMFKAKPAHNVIKVRPLKKLKAMV